MSYVLIYDAATEPYDFSFVLVFLMFCLLSGAMAFFKPIQKALWGEEKAWRARRIGKLAFGFNLFLLIVGLVSTFVFDGELRKASKQNACTSIVGVVTEFEAQTPGEPERFTVNGEAFSYSHGLHTGAYNRTVAEGSPIREGVTVRLCYVASDRLRENLIVRVEVGSGV